MKTETRRRPAGVPDNEQSPFDQGAGPAAPQGAVPEEPQRGVEAKQGFGTQEIVKRPETSISAAVAQAKAEVEAQYIIALNRPRSIDRFRQNLLHECERPGFAKVARYSKPVGGGRPVEGPSIRFAEAALRHFSNVRVASHTLYDDDRRRVVRVTVTDLESNLSYSEEVILEKVVERRKLREGQKPISQRTNSYGDKVYLVQATEDDFRNKLGAATSRIIRNDGLRLLPGDIIEECQDAIIDTLNGAIKADIDAERKKIADGYFALGIRVGELEEYLGHGLDQTTPAELRSLRATYATLRDGETHWAAVKANKKSEVIGKIIEEGGKGNGAPPPPPEGQGGDTRGLEPEEVREQIAQLTTDIDDFTISDAVMADANLTENQLRICDDVPRMVKLRDELARAKQMAADAAAQKRGRKKK